MAANYKFYYQPKVNNYPNPYFSKYKGYYKAESTDFTKIHQNKPQVFTSNSCNQFFPVNSNIHHNIKTLNSRELRKQKHLKIVEDFKRSFDELDQIQATNCYQQNNKLKENIYPRNHSYKSLNDTQNYFYQKNSSATKCNTKGLQASYFHDGKSQIFDYKQSTSNKILANQSKITFGDLIQCKESNRESNNKNVKYERSQSFKVPLNKSKKISFHENIIKTNETKPNIVKSKSNNYVSYKNFNYTQEVKNSNKHPPIFLRPNTYDLMSVLNENAEASTKENSSATLKTINELNDKETTISKTDIHTYDNLYEDVEKVVDNDIETSEFDLEIFKVQSEKAFFNENHYTVIKKVDNKPIKPPCQDAVKNVPIKAVFKIREKIKKPKTDGVSSRRIASGSIKDIPMPEHDTFSEYSDFVTNVFEKALQK